eukprot:CAMPEP_0201975990 /NCGR_PEP_ID=MMETSP0904-20121228/55679_1 /ASSEMBLY_ACC=CAM_ASM_000553 /TAXON_ID=420261 /ORGANISM="Thalassiosira antarctica, Strain CCMP982" /LENGTH=251 /DNA_ID=CAMNT_0048526933 /DNA_START=245 /DNA_END=1000 /DNA_ORIENTATION=+
MSPTFPNSDNRQLSPWAQLLQTTETDKDPQASASPDGGNILQSPLLLAAASDYDAHEYVFPQMRKQTTIPMGLASIDGRNRVRSQCPSVVVSDNDSHKSVLPQPQQQMTIPTGPTSPNSGTRQRPPGAWLPLTSETDKDTGFSLRWQQIMILRARLPAMATTDNGTHEYVLPPIVTTDDNPHGPNFSKQGQHTTITASFRQRYSRDVLPQPQQQTQSPSAQLLPAAATDNDPVEGVARHLHLHSPQSMTMK